MCSKGLSLRSDSSLRLVEWVEVLRSLGADTIFLYTYQIHPNVAKVLELSTDLREVFTVPGGQEPSNCLALSH